MKLVYSRRAIADLEAIAAYYAASTSPVIASSIAQRLEDVIDRICRIPNAAPRVSQRSRIRVVAVVAIHFGFSIACAKMRLISCMFDTHQDGP
jgi:toxin ParE1/3/4